MVGKVFWRALHCWSRARKRAMAAMRWTPDLWGGRKVGIQRRRAHRMVFSCRKKEDRSDEVRSGSSFFKLGTLMEFD